MTRLPPRAKGLRFVDLFAGGGGFTRGLVQAGLRPVAAVENYPPAVRTYAANFAPVRLLAKDVKAVTPEALGIEEGGIDLVVGGPPCEAYTRTNPSRRATGFDRLYKDPAGALVVFYARLVRLLKPRAFVMENVPGLAEPEIKRYVAEEFRLAGFRRTEFNLLRAEDAGTPSKRRRLFASNVWLELPERKDAPTVADAIGDLPAPDEAGGGSHRPYVVGAARQRRIERLSAGQALYWYPGAEGKRYPNWLRLAWDEVAPTVMGRSRFVHPEEHRLLTVREHARLMGFPDGHVFEGSLDAQYDQVGEAVPPPLAKAIGEMLRKELQK